MDREEKVGLLAVVFFASALFLCVEIVVEAVRLVQLVGAS